MATEKQLPPKVQIPRSARRACEHLWEYVNGPDNAANWLCSRCDAEAVMPVSRPDAK